MSDTPQRLDTLKKLGEKFPRGQVRKRKIGGGKEVDYVSGQAVIDRLNTAAGAWSYEITHQWVQAIEVVRYNKQTRSNEMVPRDCLVVCVAMEVPDLGRRAGMGVQVLEPGGGEDTLKGALTDALKNAAVKFGVALELYGDDMLPTDDATSPGPPGDRIAPQVTQGDDRGQNTGSRPETAQRPVQRSAGASTPPPNYGEPDKWGPGTGGGPIEDDEPDGHPEGIPRNPPTERQSKALFAIAMGNGGKHMIDQWAREVGAENERALTFDQAAQIIEKYGRKR